MKTFAIAAAALGLVSSPAFAGQQEQRSVDIKVAELDLVTLEGQRRLENRITSAARRVCGIGEIRAGTRLPYPQAAKCVEEARANAELQLASMINQRQRGG